MELIRPFRSGIIGLHQTRLEGSAGIHSARSRGEKTVTSSGSVSLTIESVSVSRAVDGGIAPSSCTNCATAPILAFIPTMDEDPSLKILEAIRTLPPDATALQRLLAWRPTTGDGWRFRMKQIQKLRREQEEPTGDGNPATTS